VPIALPAEKTLRFPSGDIELDGRIHLAAERPEVSMARMPGCVICHPHPLYGGDMDNSVVVAITAALAAMGVSTLRFNFRGVASSEGTHGGGAPEIGDAKAAVSALRTAGSLGRIAIAGYSFGSVVALRMAAGDGEIEIQGSRIDAVAAVAPPLAMFDSSFVASITSPLLLVAGSRDQYCPREAFEALAGAAGDSRAGNGSAFTTKVLLEGADHFFGGFEESLAETVAKWVSGLREPA
jgi:alpha/beta superfamily hydrolase